LGIDSATIPDDGGYQKEEDTRRWRIPEGGGNQKVGIPKGGGHQKVEDIIR
jgi:hypothetical protein